ncbi:M23 family metallopeptidase [Candidatus Fermentibacterales bacterium]|nr:M23 family metallopeptidase [Candidatus Fermentibacterales bacterium]
MAALSGVLALCILVAISFWIGRSVGEASAASRGGVDASVLEGELHQLRARTEEIERAISDIAEREEAILVAAANLNLDFSSLIPERPGAHIEGGDESDATLFRYIDDLDLRLVLARRIVEAEKMAYDTLATRIVRVTDELRHIPSIWPVNGVFVSDFGPRLDPFTGSVRYHKGIDISADTGTPILAPADGVVTFCGWSSGWGLTVVVRHTDAISTRFAHCSTIEAVVGQQVRRGDLIARVGSTGRSVGPHLHYEVLLSGTQVDPEDYIVRAGPQAAAF